MPDEIGLGQSPYPASEPAHRSYLAGKQLSILAETLDDPELVEHIRLQRNDVRELHDAIVEATNPRTDATLVERPPGGAVQEDA